jgi:hypothetical protein
MAKSTRAQSEMFFLETSEVLPSATSSLESAAGAGPSTLPAGIETEPSGPAPARASRSRSPGRTKAATIPVTSGQHGIVSSKSAALQSSLASKLRQRFDTAGGTSWPMIWKRRITPALRSVFLLSPLVRRTSDSGSGSSLMPTATAGDAESSGSRMTARSKAHPGTSLTDFVRQDGATGRLFPTPAAVSYGTSNNGCPGDGREHYRLRGKPSLETMARKDLWPTPAQRDYRHPNASSYQERGGAKKGEQLPNAVGGVLNPVWVSALMGYPPEWMACAPGKAIGKPGSRARSRSTPDESGA